MMNAKQIIALGVPILLLAVMYPIFQLLAHKFGKAAAWYCGLLIYWILWGTLFPLLLLGSNTVMNLLRPAKLEWHALLLASIPILFVAIGRIFFGVNYEKTSRLALLALLTTAIGNGIFEELLWRGTYFHLFPESVLYQMIWPSLGFALWHFAPGSVSQSGNAGRLMTGALFLGLFLSLLTRQTGTIWWSILAHTVAGIVMVM
jgi:membrane protease YdiL (CAAX protease family)